MSTNTVTPLRQRMIEDMQARQLGPASQRSHGRDLSHPLPDALGLRSRPRVPPYSNTS